MILAEYFKSIICLSLFCGCVSSKNIFETKDMKAIELYDYYTEGGTRTQSVEKIFLSLQTDSVRLLSILGSELESFNEILSQSKKTEYPKWFQQKTGVYLLFFEMTDIMNNNHRVYLCYDNSIIDIDDGIMYIVEDINHQQWLRSFQEKYRGNNLSWY